MKRFFNERRILRSKLLIIVKRSNSDWKNDIYSDPPVPLWNSVRENIENKWYNFRQLHISQLLSRSFQIHSKFIQLDFGPVEVWPHETRTPFLKCKTYCSRLVAHPTPAQLLRRNE